jgi:hypothetical protein
MSVGSLGRYHEEQPTGVGQVRIRSILKTTSRVIVF